MLDPETRWRALDLIQREALCLDEQRWNEWIELYQPDCVFWMPMWKSETRTTDDPDTELSFIYLAGRSQLEERVRRVTSGKAASSIPIQRTSHLVGPGLVTTDDASGTVIVQSAWRSRVFSHKDDTSLDHAGRYTHVLDREGDDLRIRRKTIVITDDRMQSSLDFFHI